MTATTTTTTPGRLILNKVPEVTIWFWIIKILCTTVGESLADYINTNLGFGLGGTAVLFSVVLAVALTTQFRANAYVPSLYWLVVVLVSVTGTLYTDILTDQLGVPLALSSAVFSVLLMAVFALWYRREGTLSIHSINTIPREGWYWLTVLVTFALGTATGDWILDLTGWTPGQSVLLPVTLIALIAGGWRLGANPVLAFWLAYILTRPLGANLGDYLGRGRAEGGLGIGLLVTNLVFLAAIAGVVVYLTRTRVDVVVPGQQTAPRVTTRQRETVVLAGWAVLAAAAAGVVVTASQHNVLGGAALPEKPAPVAALPPGQQAAPLTAADLAPATTITQDLLTLVHNGQQTAALAKAKDLENSWDATASALQAKNPARWTLLDGRVDAVLKSIRNAKPDAATQTSALDALLTALRG